MEFISERSQKVRDLEEFLINKGVKHIRTTIRQKIDRFRIPTTQYRLTEENVEWFNKISEFIDFDWWCRLQTTKCGGICKEKTKYRLPAFWTKQTKGCVELVILTGFYQFRIIVGYHDYNEEKEDTYGGRDAYYDFRKVCKEFGVDLDELRISSEEGKAVKETINKPKIDIVSEAYLGRTFQHAWHLDINSAYPAGMAEAFPELFNPINKLFTERKEKPENKLTLNCAWGAFQSPYLPYGGYQLAHLSKAGTEFCERKLAYMDSLLTGLGCMKLAHNTDGTWFVCSHPEKIVELEKYTSSELGGFKIDHRDVQIRFKSEGSYEFIEDGQYHPVVRGETRLEKIKPREQWTWGDIFNVDASALKWRFNNKTIKFIGNGVI